MSFLFIFYLIFYIYYIIFFLKNQLRNLFSLILGPKCSCCPTTPSPKLGVLLLHHILDIRDTLINLNSGQNIIAVCVSLNFLYILYHIFFKKSIRKSLFHILLLHGLKHITYLTYNQHIQQAFSNSKFLYYYGHLKSAKYISHYLYTVDL